MISNFVISSVRSRPKLKQHLQTVLEHLGYAADWVRVLIYQRCFSFVRSLGPERLDVFANFRGAQWRGRFAFRYIWAPSTLNSTFATSPSCTEIKPPFPAGPALSAPSTSYSSLPAKPNRTPADRTQLAAALLGHEDRVQPPRAQLGEACYSVPR